MNVNIIVKYCYLFVLTIFLIVLLAAPFGLVLLLTFGYGQKVPPTFSLDRLLESLQSNLTKAKEEQQIIDAILEKRKNKSQEYSQDLTQAFSRLSSDSEREEVKIALQQGNVTKKFPYRNVIFVIETTFVLWTSYESSLKDYQKLSNDYKYCIEKTTAEIEKIKLKIKNGKISEDAYSEESYAMQLLDQLAALSNETAEVVKNDGETTPFNIDNSQETYDLLDKIVDDAKTKQDSTPQEVSTPPPVEMKVDVMLASKHTRAGYIAFGKNAYLLAKKEGETALTFYPNYKGALDLLVMTNTKLDKLTETIQEGNTFYDSGKYAEALQKARDVKALCTSYPDADVLEKKAIKSLVEELITEGEKNLANNDGSATRENAKKALQLDSNNFNAKELEQRAVASMANALVSADWKACGANDIDGALNKVQESLKLDLNNEGSKTLFDEDIFSQTNPGSRATLKYNDVEFTFRYCPVGSFTMGSPSSESGRDEDETQKNVSISEGFWICETETTQAQWDAIGGKKEYKNNWQGKKLPVENITWNESVEFSNKLNELGIAPQGWRWTLPTEEQWEYACRAGTTDATCEKLLNECAWYKENSGGRTHQVGTKKPNNWGICDMLGNVWEWTNSKYDDGSSVVNRGGGWINDAQGCRPANRHGVSPTFWYSNRGFRLALVRSQSK